MGYLPKSTAAQLWNQPKRKKYVSIEEVEGVGNTMNALTSDMEMHNLELFLLILTFALVKYLNIFHIMFPFLFFFFGRVMYILGHCMFGSS